MENHQKMSMFNDLLTGDMKQTNLRQINKKKSEGGEAREEEEEEEKNASPNDISKEILPPYTPE